MNWDIVNNLWQLAGALMAVAVSLVIVISLCYYVKYIISEWKKI